MTDSNSCNSITDEHAPVSMKTQFNRLAEEYIEGVVNSSTGSNPNYNDIVFRLIRSFEQLWHEITASGVISSNDEIDDFSTSALELLWTPYVVGDLYQRVQGKNTSSTDDTTNNNISSNINSNNLSNMSREAILVKSHEWFDTFFEWMMQIELIDEATINKYKTYRADQRAIRIELSRLCSELHNKWNEWENKVRYYYARKAHIQKLINEDSSSNHNNNNNNSISEENDIDNREAGSEEEEILRQRALARLQWSCFDICHQLQLSSRELDMLSALSMEQRASIASSYQSQLEAIQRNDRHAMMNKPRQTYTILSGGLMTLGTLQNPQPIPNEVMEQNILSNSNNNNNNNNTALPLTLSESSESIALANNQRLFRQAVQDSLMVDRNPPTMTLEAFADKEMARMQAQNEINAQMQEQEAEENERIGQDGIEERQRVKDSKWADWRDNHPVFGPSSKGNYA